MIETYVSIGKELIMRLVFLSISLRLVRFY
jgi:hypothetical protein